MSATQTLITTSNYIAGRTSDGTQNLRLRLAGENAFHFAKPNAAGAFSNAGESRFSMDPLVGGNGVLSYYSGYLSTSKDLITVNYSTNAVTMAAGNISLDNIVAKTGNISSLYVSSLSVYQATFVSTIEGFESTATSMTGTLDVTGSANISTLYVKYSTIVGGPLDVTGATTVTTIDSSGLATLANLNVSGYANVTGDLAVTASTIVGEFSAVHATIDNLNVTTDATVGGALTVTGATSVADLSAATVTSAGVLTVSANGADIAGGIRADTLNTTGAVGVATTLTVTGDTNINSFNVGNGKVTINASTGTIVTQGNLSVAGTALISQNATFSSTIAVSARATLSGGAVVTGGLSTNTIAASGNAAITGTLDVTGVASFVNAGISGTATIGTISATTSGLGAATANSFTTGGIIVSGSAQLNAGVTVNGGLTNVASFSASGSASITSTLTTTGAAFLNGGLTVAAGASVGGGLSSDTLTTSASATVGTTLAVTGATTVAGVTASGGVSAASFTTTGAASVGTLSSSGLATLNSISTISHVDVGGHLKVGAAANFYSNLTVSGVTALNSSATVLLGLSAANSLGSTINVNANYGLSVANGILSDFALVSGTVDANAFATTSDSRLKKDVEEVADALAKVKALRPVHYNWISSANFNPESKELGFLAQEVEEVVPAVVATGADVDATKRVAYDRLTALLVGAVKEQSIVIDALQVRVAALESRA